MLLSIFSIAYMDLRRKSKTVPMLCQYCGVFSLLAVTASYRQVKLLRRLDVLLLLSSRILRFCAQNISGRFLKQIVSKLTHAQIGMYFMYLGAVVGSSGLMSSDATASLISRDIVPDAESFNPNRSLRELFVNCSPCTCLIQACK